MHGLELVGRPPKAQLVGILAILAIWVGVGKLAHSITVGVGSEDQSVLREGGKSTWIDSYSLAGI